MAVRLFPSLAQQAYYIERRKETLRKLHDEIKAKDRVIEAQEDEIEQLKIKLKKWTQQ